MTDKTENTKAPRELSHEDLDKVQGAGVRGGTKGLLGDDLGFPNSGGKKGNKKGWKVEEGE